MTDIPGSTYFAMVGSVKNTMIEHIITIVQPKKIFYSFYCKFTDCKFLFKNCLPTTSRHISLGLQFLICSFCFNIRLELRGTCFSASETPAFCTIGPVNKTYYKILIHDHRSGRETRLSKI